MPRRSMLSAAERESLITLPNTQYELIRRYTLSDSDLSIVRQRRGATNRLGSAVQLCYMRYPGIVLGLGELPFPPLLDLVAAQLRIPVEKWARIRRPLPNPAGAYGRTSNTLWVQIVHDEPSPRSRAGSD
jgi:TnpA family transposase